MKAKYWYAGMTAAALFYSAGAVKAQQENKVEIVGNSPVVQWQGWGCSLAWWAKEWGETPLAPRLADLVFSYKNVNLNGVVLPGLGMNAARYNVGGGGGGATIGSLYENVSPKMIPATNIRGYWLTGTNPNPNSSDWNWHRDKAQRHMLMLALKRSVNLVEFFSNSPPWWMNKNLSTGGGDQGKDNLRNKYNAAFAHYMACVVQHAEQYWHIPVTSVEPFNEPLGSWWQFPSGQEGCHFSDAHQAAVIPLLREEMNRLGLSGKVQLAASDENTSFQAAQTWQFFSPAVRRMIDKVNTHTYEQYGPNLPPLGEEVKPLPLWVSENGEGDASGYTLARTIVHDIYQLQPVVWCYWQPLDSGGWGMIYADRSNGSIDKPERKYYVMAEYSRAIRAGSEILLTTQPDVTAAFEARTHTLHYVFFSKRTSASFQFILPAQQAEYGKAVLTETTTHPGAGIPDYKYASVPTGPVLQGRITVTLPPQTVASLTIHNVRRF